MLGTPGYPPSGHGPFTPGPHDMFDPYTGGYFYNPPPPMAAQGPYAPFYQQMVSQSNDKLYFET
jgi:hypothetical protein